MAATSDYALETIREGADFTLYRGRQRHNSKPVLVVAPSASPPRPRILQRLEHEYALATELDSAWAARPIALGRHEGRIVLVIEDPGGDPLDRLLEQERERPRDLARLLRIAIGLARALGQNHKRGLIHKDIKPENVFADGSGHVWLTGFGINIAIAARAAGPRTSRDRFGNLRLHVARADRPDESID